jgi:EAL and modified HD-GYP domain-containing signal transduction protein
MDFFVARQPIFKQNRSVYGYELLYRSNEKNFYDASIDGEKASVNVLLNSILGLGLDVVAEGKKAFINITEGLVKENMMDIFVNQNIVIEINENVIPDDILLEKCRELKEAGHLLALDDYVFEEEHFQESIMEYIDILKVDFLDNSLEDIARIIKLYRKKYPRLIFLAEKIETVQDFQVTSALGYDLFQGFYFSKPVIMKGKKVSTSQVNYLMIFQELWKEEPDFDSIAERISTNVTLSYKFLKLINSSFYGMKREITSIKEALVPLGIKEIRKVISLFFIQDNGEKENTNITSEALTRAHMAETIAPLITAEKIDSSEAFLMGLFSKLDALLNEPLDLILENIMIGEHIKNALLETEDSAMRNLLYLIRDYEYGGFELAVAHAEKLGIRDIPGLSDIYMSSLKWSHDIHQQISRS